MTKFTEVYEQFLWGIKSCTFASYTDIELEEALYTLLIQSIAMFKFPKISLEYTKQENENLEEEWVFVETLRQQEINVIVFYMNLFWLRYQLMKEDNFEQYYYDKNTQTHSRGNLIQQLNAAISAAEKAAQLAEYNYGRTTLDNKPALDIEW